MLEDAFFINTGDASLGFPKELFDFCILSFGMGFWFGKAEVSGIAEEVLLGVEWVGEHVALGVFEDFESDDEPVTDLWIFSFVWA